MKQVASCIIELGCTFNFKEEEEGEKTTQFKEFLKHLKSIPNVEEILSIDWCDIDFIKEE